MGDIAIQSNLFGVAQTESTSDDYYTPKWVFDALGLTFDLDVASPMEPIPYIPAVRHFTQADDGLAQTWYGRVWMNPPYSAATAWVDRFLAHGNGVALLPCAKSAWFYRMWTTADALTAPNASAQFFAGGKSISYPVVLAAMGQECTDALLSSGIGRCR